MYLFDYALPTSTHLRSKISPLTPPTYLSMTFQCFLLSLCLCTHAVGTSSDREGDPSCGYQFDFSFSSLDTLPPATATDTHLSPEEIRGGSFQSDTSPLHLDEDSSTAFSRLLSRFFPEMIPCKIWKISPHHLHQVLLIPSRQNSSLPLTRLLLIASTHGHNFFQSCCHFSIQLPIYLH